MLKVNFVRHQSAEVISFQVFIECLLYADVDSLRSRQSYLTVLPRCFLIKWSHHVSMPALLCLICSWSVSRNFIHSCFARFNSIRDRVSQICDLWLDSPTHQSLKQLSRYLKADPHDWIISILRFENSQNWSSTLNCIFKFCRDQSRCAFEKSYQF